MPTPIDKASITQQKTLAIVPKVSSLLSLLGSIYMIQDVLRLKPSKRKLYHRIILGMSVCDTLASFAWFFTTWPIPPEVLQVWGASGTEQTCDAQGFFAQFSIASVLYNGSLALYYFLVIQRGWSQRRLEESKIEYYMHTFSLLFGVVTASVSVGLGLMNPIGWDCWIAAAPIGCKESFSNGGKTTCTRGDNSNIYQWAFFYAPLWFIIFCVTIAMSMIIHKFMKQEKKNTNYGAESIIKQSAVKNKGEEKPKKSQVLVELKKQNCLYVGSFYLAWLFPTILRITELAGDVVYFHWVMLSASFVPLQGFLNMIVYLRPQFIKVKKQRKILENQRENNDGGNPESSMKLHVTVRDIKKAILNGDDGACPDCDLPGFEITTSSEDGGIPPDISSFANEADVPKTNELECPDDDCPESFSPVIACK